MYRNVKIVDLQGGVIYHGIIHQWWESMYPRFRVHQYLANISSQNVLPWRRRQAAGVSPEPVSAASQVWRSCARHCARGSPCIRPVSVHTFPRGQGVSSVIPEERCWKVTDSRWEDVHSPSWPWPSPPHWPPRKRPASAADMPWTLCRSVGHNFFLFFLLIIAKKNSFSHP